MKRISAKEAQVMLAQAGARGNRRVTGARRTELDGITFDSKREATAWASLTQAQRAGLISNLERQVDIPLMGEKGPILTPTGRQMHYRADFVFVEKGLRIIADAKGYATEKFTLKKAILAAMGYSIRII